MFGKTPMDLGGSIDDLDSMWEEAMFEMKSAYESERAGMIKASTNRPHA